MVFVELHVEAKFADFYIWTHHALILGFVQKMPLAAGAIKCPIILRQALSAICRSPNQLANCFSAIILHVYLFLLVSESLGVFVELIEPIWSPVCPTQGTLHWFAIFFVVFEASLEAVCVDLPSTAV